MTSTPLKEPQVSGPKASIRDEHPVELVVPEACPRFAGRVIRNIDMSQQNRRSGWWNDCGGAAFGRFTRSSM